MDTDMQYKGFIIRPVTILLEFTTIHFFSAKW